MNDPDIFLTDFEITETTDCFHAILGRSLIVATRFDSLCHHACVLIRFKSRDLPLSELEVFKFRALARNIQKIVPKGTLPELFNIFDKAKDARNSIAHELCKGMTGCIDTKVTDLEFCQMVRDVIEPIAIADYWISYYLSIANEEPLLQTTSAAYSQRIVNWVLDENCLC
ncbi:hypothetical protein A165_05945 [Vibrio tasmaniensis ZS-17]|uniref:hypothetical protein n=1 Tax=Vibrio tasmaniensis TaxID=212663 RepID=UPI0003614C6F|nr:hypothetical protein [Vibrio tasmaniensis]OED66734.1 hypothetical protein A165_05945 [Vibrio tasmaniensis ZS-17]